MPSDKTELEIPYGEEDDATVSVDDGNCVPTTGNDLYLIHLFKAVNNNTADNIKVRINVRSSYAPTTSTVYLQVWNVTLSTWETVDSNNTAGASEFFDLEVTISTDKEDYYDTDYEVAFRVYQENF